MASTLTELAKRKTATEQAFLSRQSISWLQKSIQELKNPSNLSKEIASEKSRQRGTFKVGGLYHFFYDPLTKDNLPYWDIFPLVIPLNRGPDGFLGLNLHYLPVMARAAFMDKLMNFALLDENDEPKRLMVTYDILKVTRNLREFRACIKHYLNEQIRSKIMVIRPNEWEVALFLPTQHFVGASANKIYRDSLTKSKNRAY